MVTHGRPTRAEVSDVANAVLDGADALMLSAETSVGAHPACAVTTMSRITEAAETEALATVRPLLLPPRTRSSAQARAAVDLGTAIGARTLVAFTQTGETARRLSRHRSAIPLVAFTPAQAVRNRLALSWGVETFLVPTVATTDEMVAQVDAKMLPIRSGSPR